MPAEISTEKLNRKKNMKKTSNTTEVINCEPKRSIPDHNFQKRKKMEIVQDVRKSLILSSKDAAKKVNVLKTF